MAKQSQQVISFHQKNLLFKTHGFRFSAPGEVAGILFA